MAQLKPKTPIAIVRRSVDMPSTAIVHLSSTYFRLASLSTKVVGND